MKIFNKILIVLLAVVLTSALTKEVRAATAVDLGTADNFAVLGASTVTNTGSSVVNGDLGLYAGTSVTGFPPGVVTGTQHITDTTAQQAQIDLTAAYNSITSQTPNITVPSELGGTTKTPGIYVSTPGTFQITGTLTLDAGGDPNAVFIFKAGTTLTTAASSVVNLINGAQPCNVYWIIGSSAATIGANSTFKGNILALTSITLTTGANIEGRTLSRTGAVTLDDNIITRAVCAVIPPPPPPPPAVPPLISVLKVPTPLTLTFGGGSVTYNYTVTNIGTEAMSNVHVTDNKCSTVTYVSGDTNSNSILETTETWHYHCTTSITLTTSNTVTATGDANGLTAIDTANATVVVGVASPAPLIHLVKVPNHFVVQSGGTVTYTYTVTNPGTETLSSVSVVDDKCSPISGPSGDTNSNNLLEPSETWIYTCSMALTQSTVNTGIAEGTANGLTALDVAIVSVAVQAVLPDTSGGIITKEVLPWSTIIVGLATISSITLLYSLSRRRKVIV